MNVDGLLALLDQYGYAALFFSLFLGVVGMPVPDEALAMVGGFVSARGYLRTVPALLVTYAGVASGINIGYWIGRAFGVRIVEAAANRWPKVRRHAEAGQRLLRAGWLAILLTYFIPGVRHIVPYLIGAAGTSFPGFLVRTLPGSILWVLLYFTIGFQVGDNWYAVALAARRWSMIGVGVVAALFGLYVWVSGRYRVRSAGKGS